MRVKNILGFAFTVLVSLISFPSPAADSINITNGEWAPYLSEKLPGYGTASQIVQEAFEKEGIDVNYGFFTWARAYEEAKKGTEWQASVIWTRNDERAELFYFSDPVIALSDVLFYIRGHQVEWKSIRDLNKYRIGLTRGYFYGDEIANAEKSGYMQIERTTTEVLNFKKLLRGRLDAVISGKDVGNAIIKDNFTDAERFAFTSHSKPTRTVSYHVIISKQTPGARQYIKAVNSGLRKLAAEGRIAEILK